MPVRAVVYVSRAGEEIAGDKLGLSNGKLDQIVDDAARFNRNAGVTGGAPLRWRTVPPVFEGA